MINPICDPDCTRMGWVEYLIEADGTDIHVSVPLDADLDDRILAFDHDEQEMLWVNGWLFSWERIEDDRTT